MMSIHKRKSSSTCAPDKNRKRSRRAPGSELAHPASEHNQQQQQPTDESVWIFGLINNIEQLLSTFNGACSANSGASSGTSTPNSASSPASSSGSCRSGYQPAATCASLSSAPRQGPTAPSTLPRHSLSRQIKFHEYKGPPTARRASGPAKQTATSTGHSQPVARTTQAQLAQPLALKSEPQPPPQVHQRYQHHQEQLRVQHHTQQLAAGSSSSLDTHSGLPLGPQQAPDLLQFQAAAQCCSAGSTTNQLTSVGEPALHNLCGARDAALGGDKTSGAHSSSLAEAEQRAVDAAERLGWRLPEQPADWQQPQQPLIQERSLQTGKPLGSHAAFALSTDSDDETDTNEIEPSIDFGLGGEELLFSEFIDLQDVPLNVDESDWLKKFLPPCSMSG